MPPRNDSHARNPMQAPTKPILFVEVQLTDKAATDPLVRSEAIRREISKYIADNFVQVQINQHLSTSFLMCGKYIRNCQIVDHSESISYADDGFYPLVDTDLQFSIYHLFNDEDELFASQPEGEESTSFKAMPLPHKALDGLWESLIFEEPIPESALRVIMSMLTISQQPLFDPTVLNWHNLALLYGPPGSGKTTLAKALAQRLSIRLSHIYPMAKLLEINSSTILSKWFGESSKQVGKLFKTITAISTDKSLLTVVIIDEVETLASSREKASQSDECGDAIRSTNELLQGLDRLCRCPNVMLICTSNLINSLDDAFVDRCTIQKFVATPNAKCSFEIFRSVINKLIDMNSVFFDSSDLEQDLMMENSDGCNYSQTSSLRSWNMESYDGALGPENASYSSTRLPSFEWVERNFANRDDTLLWEFRTLAINAAGLSGRALRRLPTLARFEYKPDKPCSLRDLLHALSKGIAEKHKNNNQDQHSTRTIKQKAKTIPKQEETSVDEFDETIWDDISVSP
ncbi:AAA-domain-containing protein [Pleomassaria siparia CBS 279.74]|uniref:AAA-domain-containing protein n=1 Tax=Pleomassaria siparia CBS 279.74 TaxID=1314801 RepID=A0A6G1KCD5_9PLEO|nr:AAA-domain-containing protein [Pleomassaria siparia CBS 279.74]